MTPKFYIVLLISFVFTVFSTAQSVHIRVQNFTSSDGLATNVVNTIIQDQQGYLWLGTNHGLTRFDGHRFENFYIKEGEENHIEGITHIVEDTARNVLLMSGKDYRLLCFDLKRMQFASADGMAFPSHAENETDEAFYTKRAHQLGIERGNITHRRHDLHYVKTPDGVEIFTTIDNGFYLYDPKTKDLHHFSRTDENPIIESNYINDIFLDRSGSLWLATTFAGIYQLDIDEGLLSYNTSISNVRSFSELSDGTVAVGDMEGNVFAYDPQSKLNKLIFNKGHRAYAMRTDRKGRFWIATRGGGVWVIEREKEKVKSEKLLDLPARQIFDVCLSPDGTAWVGTFDGGLIEAKEQSDGSFSYTTYLPDEKIHQILIDRQKRIWVATENGVFRKDGKDFLHIFNKGKVVCVTQGPADTIYAGSNGYGLLMIADDCVERFTTSNGLANNCVEAITVDGHGRIIAATDQGVSIINHHDGTVQNVYSPLGLIADTYNEDAILYTSDGRIFLGSQRGLAELRIKNTKNDKYELPHITSIDINDVPHYGDMTEEWQLAHHQNNLCFNFSSFAYKNLSSVIYSYRLDGVDRDWRPATRESRALYTDLRPGRYCFHVRYRLSGGQWSQESVCQVCIAQPWWWTWWARLFYLLIITLFIWYEWHQYQQRLSLHRQLDRRLTALYAAPLPDKERTEENRSHNGTLQKAEQPTEATQNKEFIYQLDHLILSNLLKSDLDMNFIAQEMCMSYSTLNRRIKTLTGMTANEYVRKHRLAKAMQLLRDGHNASEVSMQCGFNSPSYFTRCFKAEYGILPSEV